MHNHDFPPKESSGVVILLVDDDEAILKIVAKALEMKGFRVLTATNGREALTSYERQGGRVGAVLTDTIMPVMDGVALTRMLMETDPSVKIIASTGKPNPSVQEELSRLGVKAFLAKPYTIGKLMEILRRVMCDSALQLT